MPIHHPTIIVHVHRGASPLGATDRMRSTNQQNQHDQHLYLAFHFDTPFLVFISYPQDLLTCRKASLARMYSPLMSFYFFAGFISHRTLTITQRPVILTQGTKYYWRAKAKNAGGFGLYSVIRNFTTQQLPGQITLLSPQSGAAVAEDSVLLVWQRAGTVNERYWLQVATDSLFVSGTIDSTLTDSVRVVRQLLASQEYWWKVRAGNNAGWGPFSETRSFMRLATSVGEGISGLPEVFSLSQNYPNPFNPSTVIAYALPGEVDVRLEVFNLLGERVALLVDEKMPAGYHSVTFDGQGLSSGLYFYRIRAGDFEQTKKLALVR